MVSGSIPCLGTLQESTNECLSKWCFSLSLKSTHLKKLLRQVILEAYDPITEIYGKSNCINFMVILWQIKMLQMEVHFPWKLMV